jgi:dipeptidyl-peptidase 4
MRALLFAAVLAVVPGSAMAKQLTLDRIFNGASLAGAAPRQVQIAPDGSRVTFLRPQADDQRTFDLWSYDIADGRLHKLVPAEAIAGEGADLSAAERDRRERERTAGLRGIVDYGWSHDGKRLLIPAADALYLYELDKPPAQALTRLDTGGGVIDPRFSPRGDYVSYVQGQNLWVIALATGKRTQLTFDGGGTVHNGEAEFVAQEEMERSRGYWWAPDDSAIAYEQYDAAPVAIARRLDIGAEGSTVVEQRYPYAGGANVTARLGLVAATGGDTRWIDLGPDPDIYLARVNWTPDARHLAYQRESRDQRRLDLQLVDANDLTQRTLLTETSPVWINLNDDLRFLDDGSGFIWGSDRSGYHQLYLYGMDGRLEHAIGAGDWRIDGVLGVDQAHGRVYVSSNRDAAIDRQVYALALDGSTADAPVRITRRDGTHQAIFAPDASFYVDTFSDPSTPPQVSVHRADGTFLAWIEENRLDHDHPYWPYMDSHVVPEFGTLKAADGQLLHYRIYKPPHFDPNKRYPVFDHFYGGPHAQMVTRGWIDPFAEYMAQQGFVVFTLDNRGMARRGRRFADVLAGQLGVDEVEDQVAGIHWLQKQPWVAADRIGVFGWSYGGYLSLMLLAKDSADIAAGIAVAPVTDWRLYDTFYSERYLGRPQDHDAAYTRSSPFAWLDGMTSPLLLIHGMADDNVLFENSTRLMAALQARDVSFELMTYPGGRHGLDRPGQRRHAFGLIVDFMRRHLEATPPTPRE